MEILKKLANNEKEGENTLVFVYYAGHGVSDNYSFALVNDINRPWFPIEQNVRVISKAVGSYIIALFDCCREKIKVPKSNTSASGSTSVENFIMTFGCPPTQ